MAPSQRSTSPHRGTGPRRVPRCVLAVVASLAFLLAGCSSDRITGRASGPADRTTAAESDAPAPSNAPDGRGRCVNSGWFDCDFRDRFARVERYLRNRPGVVGVEVHDRVTGAVWSSANADVYIWTASSIKLAIAVNLLQRNRAGEIELNEDDWQSMRSMLTESDNYSTDYLWSAYGGLPSEAYLNYGLPDLLVTEDLPGVWGSELATPTGMAGLVDYALANLDPPDADWLVDAASSVIDEQRWGVLGLDDDARAGAKNGWDEEPTGWVVNSVGFLGPHERYSVAIMNDVGEDGGFDDGVQTVSKVAQLLFADRF